jgi:POT family proton-dependent oligopeptide transporter
METQQMNQPTWLGHPRGLVTLFMTEFFERFTYYGMRALLVFFLTAAATAGNPGIGVSEATAGAIYGLYTGAVYLFSLPGGWIADRLIGQRNAVFWGGVIIMIGNFMLSIPGAPPLFYLGLAVIVVGVGLLKPNISAIVGELYKDQPGARRDAGFSIFYAGINLGALLAPLVAGTIGEAWNYRGGFFVAGLAMAIGLVLYRITEENLGNAGVEPHPTSPEERVRGFRILYASAAALAILVGLVYFGAIPVSVTQLAQGAGIAMSALGIVYFAAVLIFADLTPEERGRIGVIAIFFLCAAMFWAGFEQAATTFNLFARDYTDRALDPAIDFMIHLPTTVVVTACLLVALFGFCFYKSSGRKWRIFHGASTLALAGLGFGLYSYLASHGFTDPVRVFVPEYPASWWQSANPIFVVIFAPMFAYMWVALGARNLDPDAPAKFGLGLLLLGFGFLVMMGAAQVVISSGAKVGGAWLLMTYLLHTIGELCLSPVGLSNVTKLAPQRFVGQMMGTWFLGTALGNLAAGLVGGHVGGGAVAEMPSQFLTMAFVGGGVGLLMLALSPMIRKMMGGVK